MAMYRRNEEKDLSAMLQRMMESERLDLVCRCSGVWWPGRVAEGEFPHFLGASVGAADEEDKASSPCTMATTPAASMLWGEGG
jgi:hypothetical protein